MKDQEHQAIARHGRGLVVDDDVGMQRLLSRVLAMHGLRADRVGDGEQGLRRALSTSYDVVLLDLQLPQVDGMAVLRSLLSARPGQAVIVCSCQSDPRTRTLCLEAGARALVSKPFSLADLSTCLVDALACTRPAAEAI